VQVKFAPTAAVARMGSLRVTGEPGGSVLTKLIGTGLPPAALAISPSFTDFGNTFPGGETRRTLTVTNTGGGASGGISFALSGSAPSDFGIVNDGCTTLPPGGSCTVEVRFAPTTPGAPFLPPRTATLTASATPGGNAQSQLVGRAF
jgi:hypothetical protein